VGPGNRPIRLTKDMDRQKYFAIIGADDTVRVVRASPDPDGRPSIKPERLSFDTFADRSAANGIGWRATSGNLLVTEVDRFGVTIIETRLQLR
jgi:hypothetical protein